MKALIRSIIVVDPTTDMPVAAYQNCLKLEQTNISCDIPADQNIWDYVREFARNNGHAPNIQTVRDHFVSNRDDDVINRLELLVGVRPIYRGDFQTHAKNIAEQRNVLGVINLCKKVSRIAHEGNDNQKRQRGKTVARVD